ncbi:hypothetical protein WL57_31905 [Burkholderia cepacia]|nr:hypothetical protein WL57_31905 [Burkholderia cepacia]
MTFFIVVQSELQIWQPVDEGESVLIFGVHKSVFNRGSPVAPPQMKRRVVVGKIDDRADWLDDWPVIDRLSIGTKQSTAIFRWFLNHGSNVMHPIIEFLK